MTDLTNPSRPGRWFGPLGTAALLVGIGWGAGLVSAGRVTTAAGMLPEPAEIRDGQSALQRLAQESLLLFEFEQTNPTQDQVTIIFSHRPVDPTQGAPRPVASARTSSMKYRSPAVTFPAAP